MTHLRSVKRQISFGDENRFPFNLPVIQHLEELSFPSPVTLFVGENGSGKSTLLEAIACAASSITVGSEQVAHDQTLEPIRYLARGLNLTWNKRTRKGFFLRAEDFFGYVKTLSRMKRELETELENVDLEYKDHSILAQNHAKMPYKSQLQGLQARYGDGLDVRSHGESFLALFQSRFVPGGLYLLDEPEAPLSPVSQLGLISMIKTMVAEDAQFIIATHSPILMAFPEGMIYDFDRIPIAAVPYSELEQVNLLKDFLNNTENYIRHL